MNNIEYRKGYRRKNKEKLKQQDKIRDNSYATVEEKFWISESCES